MNEESRGLVFCTFLTINIVGLMGTVTLCQRPKTTSVINPIFVVIFKPYFGHEKTKEKQNFRLILCFGLWRNKPNLKTEKLTVENWKRFKLSSSSKICIKILCTEWIMCEQHNSSKNQVNTVFGSSFDRMFLPQLKVSK